ncbi:MAG TPA: hypothetical protein VGY54_26735, partial [Polyangiaceae bacterium]|nr:hypothetical protein [Polyangiaceae bacterium]
IRLSIGPIETLQSLETVTGLPDKVRNLVDIVQCNEPALSAKELREAQALEAKALKWADNFEEAVALEARLRAEVVLPLCRAIWIIDGARARIARERANPSGVVDLKRLHDWGQDIQEQQLVVDDLRPKYVAQRHHAFSKWESEGVCVAQVNKPEAN